MNKYEFIINPLGDPIERLRSFEHVRSNKSQSEELERAILKYKPSFKEWIWYKSQVSQLVKHPSSTLLKHFFHTSIETAIANQDKDSRLFQHNTNTKHGFQKPQVIFHKPLTLILLICLAFCGCTYFAYQWFFLDDPHYFRLVGVEPEVKAINENLLHIKSSDFCLFGSEKLKDGFNISMLKGGTFNRSTGVAIGNQTHWREYTIENLIDGGYRVKSVSVEILDNGTQSRSKPWKADLDKYAAFHFAYNGKTVTLYSNHVPMTLPNPPNEVEFGGVFLYKGEAVFYIEELKWLVLQAS